MTTQNRFNGVETISATALPSLTSDAPREAVALVLAALAELTRNPHLARAGDFLRSIPAGRPSIDDSAALAQMRALRRQDPRLPVSRAAAFVAATLPHQHTPDATAIRLARKFRRAAKN